MFCVSTIDHSYYAPALSNYAPPAVDAPASLIAGRLRPSATVQRSIPMHVAQREHELRTVREAIDDGRNSQERAMDVVVDKLLKELSW